MLNPEGEKEENKGSHQYPVLLRSTPAFCFPSDELHEDVRDDNRNVAVNTYEQTTSFDSLCYDRFSRMHAKEASYMKRFPAMSIAPDRPTRCAVRTVLQVTPLQLFARPCAQLFLILDRIAKSVNR